LVWSSAALAIMLVGIAGLFAYYVKDLPNPRKLSERFVVESTKIYDRNGELLFNFHGEQNRTRVEFDQISDHVKKATIALEDASFYKHPGFDVKGLSRAIICRLPVCGGRVSGGGSTITQQYVRNADVGITRERSSNRKLREIILSIEIEQIYGKDEILTGYLNEIPYGANAYGIEAAAQTYFRKAAAELSLAEAATLASIPQRPTFLSPYGNNLPALFARKDYTLDRMARVGFITQEEADAAKAEAPNLESPSFAPRSNITAPHFVFYVREKLIDFLDDDPATAELKLDQAGFNVYTSLDLETQRLAESILAEMGPSAVDRYQASNAAITAVDPKTGEIIAMAGSIDYNNSRSGNTNFAAANLQPGSAFKPLVYVTAFGKKYKYSPASITFDLPTDFGGGYRPNNYNGQFSGPITNRNALARSLNVPAVKNLYLVGIPDALKTAESLGITTLTEPQRYGLSLVLGSGEVKPVELAAAYGTFGNEGKRYPLRPILRIERAGSIIKDFTKEEATQAVEPEVAFQMSHIMADNGARAPVFGTRNHLTLGPDRPVAAKSGTTQNNRDAWTVGYTPQISVAVWVGNNEPNKTMIRGADGSIVAGPMWNRFMREYLKGKPVEQFKRPDTIREFTVDRLSGKIPTNQSPPDQRITDIFAPWQIPTDFDDVHVRVSLDRVSGKLATELTPEENIVVRFFCRIRSEVPDNPNWEAPVQAWAASNGCTERPPTERDDVHTEGNRPSVSITSPSSGSTVTGTFTITATTGGSRPISKVDFYINSVLIGTATKDPWSTTYDANSLPAGSSIIEAVVRNDLGLTRTDQVTITKGAAANPPGAVSNISSNSGKFAPPSKPIKINWKNPNSPDITTAIISYSGPSGSGTRTVAVTPNSNGTLDFTGPIGTYTFTIRVRNSAGLEGPASPAFTEQMLP
jgi:membrane peptidoglycan carboxypeptidase